MMNPGVQIPHCKAACSRNFCCKGCSLDGVASPSIVATSLPAVSTARTRQESTRTPSSKTLQAPQLPLLQPSLVPVSPRSSRRTSNRLCRGSQRKSTSSPLIRVWMCTLGMTHRLPSGSGNGTLQSPPCQHPDEVAALLDSTAHITNRSGRRLRGSGRLGYGRVRNGLADEGSRSFVNQQWGGCNGTQGNARRSHRSTIIAEHHRRAHAHDGDVHLIAWDEAQIVCPKIFRRCGKAQGH